MYQSTLCAVIQAQAIDIIHSRVSVLMTWSGVLFILLVADMGVEMFISVRLVTVPIITLSMQAVASYLLILPATVSKHGLFCTMLLTNSPPSSHHIFFLIVLVLPPHDMMFGALTLNEIDFFLIAFVNAACVVLQACFQPPPSAPRHHLHGRYGACYEL